MFNSNKNTISSKSSINFSFKNIIYIRRGAFILSIILSLSSFSPVYALDLAATEQLSMEESTTVQQLENETTTEPTTSEEATFEQDTTELTTPEETTFEQATTEPTTTEVTTTEQTTEKSGQQNNNISKYTIPDGQKINPVSLKGKDGYISVKWVSTKRYYGFNLYRRIYGKNKWKKIKTLQAEKNERSYQYDDYKTTTGNRYEYAVIGLDRSDEEMGRLSLLGLVYARPSHVQNVKVSFVSSNSVKIKWHASQDVSGYFIYRSFDTIKWSKIYTINSKKKNKYTDEIGVENKHCHYKVIPFVMVGNKHISGTTKIKFATVRSVKGIDVSYHNGRIDWKKVKESGVDFAFIRVGYGDSSKASGGVLDPEFKRNVKNARKNGIDIGVYLYSTAVNVAQAKREAEFVIESIKGYGAFEYPIVYDFESEYRKRYSCKSENTEMVTAFFKKMEDAGYKNVTIYSDFNMIYRYLKYKKIKKKYGCWMAYWTYDYDRFPTDKIDNVKFWQYSDRGRIPGITEDVDLNVRYVTGN